MHGIMFSEFRQYAEARIGAHIWPVLVEDAGLPNRTFMVAQQFPRTTPPHSRRRSRARA